MKNLRPLLNKRHNLPKWLVGAFLLISLLGFADAAYLSVMHYRDAAPPCAIVTGCETVTTSQYAVAFSVIPVAVLGALYYFTLMALMVGYLDTRRLALAIAAFALTPVGLLASAYFSYLQMFVLNAWCLYCIGSIMSSTLLFFLGIAGYSHKKYLVPETVTREV